MISGIELKLQGWMARISDEGFIRFVCDRAVRLDMVLYTAEAETS